MPARARVGGVRLVDRGDRAAPDRIGEPGGEDGRGPLMRLRERHLARDLGAGSVDLPRQVAKTVVSLTDGRGVEGVGLGDIGTGKSSAMIKTIILFCLKSVVIESFHFFSFDNRSL